MWPSKYPTYEDLRTYFEHCDKVLYIKTNTASDGVVVEAQFDTSEGQWHIQTADGRMAEAKYLVVVCWFRCKALRS